MKANLKEKKEVAKGTMLFVYEILGQKVDFTPGQYFYIEIKQGLKHHFTIVNSPTEKGILSFATRMRDSEFKNTIKSLSIGSEAKVTDIEGDFILPQATSRHLVLIALGIGVTPYVSMIRFIKEEKLDYKITLIYSDSDKESMAYLDELEDYSKENPNFKIIPTINEDKNWSGEKRLIDENFINDYFDNPNINTYFVSGPPKAVDSVAKSIEKAGVEKENIRTEDFSGY